MPKSDAFQDLALAPRRGDQELWRWLYEQLRAAIVEGRLRPGARLPSTRNLGTQYGVSRGTVTMAFDQLMAEGFTRAEVGSGTYVASGIPDPVMPRGSRTLPQGQRSTAGLSKRGHAAVANINLMPVPRAVGRAFRAFEPALDLFPSELWARTAARVLRAAPRSLYGHGDPAGYLPLRRAIADYAGASRGVRCTPEQVIVTSGAQQALDLVGRLLLDLQDEAWMEDPAYPAVWQAWHAHGARIVRVPVDRDGLMVSEGRRLAPRARLAYVTPSNQFPLGVTLSAERRMELLAWASAAGAWIVEDEYDAEYRYSGRPVASLQSVDRAGSVVYVGTFTKMLFNALRLGFLVLPDRLVDAFVRARSLVDRHPPTLDQAILAEFVSEGHFARHVRRMRQVYSDRMGTLKRAADQRLRGLLDVDVAVSGMRTLGWLEKHRSDRRAAERARELGLEVTALSGYVTAFPQKPGLILGFAGVNPRELTRGVEVLARALE
jgi:GntR family transcriptional regulator/MocR family aminotransferase